MNSDRINSALQSRLLSLSMWGLILVWLLVPWCGVLNSQVPHLGSVLVVVLSACVMCLSIAGLRRAEVRSGWFIVTFLVALLALVHGLHPVIGFPVLN